MFKYWNFIILKLLINEKKKRLQFPGILLNKVKVFIFKLQYIYSLKCFLYVSWKFLKSKLNYKSCSYIKLNFLVLTWIFSIHSFLLLFYSWGRHFYLVSLLVKKGKQQFCFCFGTIGAIFVWESLCLFVCVSACVFFWFVTILVCLCVVVNFA